MKQVKWFDRKFEFVSEQNILPSIIERLEGTPIRLDHKIHLIPKKYLTIRHEEKWSIQENIGHLADLEPLWQDRLGDILGGAEYLRTADLENKKTNAAKHNKKDVNQLLHDFQNLRRTTVAQLNQLSEEDAFKYALHPRLHQPMRVMDLFLFVAEHDDHHLARISELSRLLTR